MKNVTIFGVRIDSMDAEEIFRIIDSSKDPIWIVTANPEILLYAKNHPDYREMLNHASMRLIDSFGLALASRLKGIDAKRLPGADLAHELVRHAFERHQKIALIGGGKQHSANPAFKQLQTHFSGLQGIALDGGSVSEDGAGDEENASARKKISESNPSVLLVGFGHPKQERWIERYRSEFPTVRVFIGVGGTFDYWSGLIPRAPKWMRSIGLEWLYRLGKEPKRWKRIFKAVFVFPFHFIQGR